MSLALSLPALPHRVALPGSVLREMLRGVFAAAHVADKETQALVRVLVRLLHAIALERLDTSLMSVSTTMLRQLEED